VARLILGETAGVVAAGLVAGALLALWTAPLARALIYGLAPQDPTTFALTAVLMLAVGLVASFLPARRAAGVNPMIALRAE
jgi:ABC-type antimicrobial peptide transport system permease subunit